MRRNVAALLIGIDNYWNPGWPALHFAESDCDKLAESLRRFGFTRRNSLVAKASYVEPALRPNNFNFAGLFNHFAQADLETFVLYFAGHGVEHAGCSYLVPADAIYNDPKTYISLSEMLQRLLFVRAKQKLMILDVCHGGSVRSGQGPIRPLPDSFDRELKNVQDAIVLSACNIHEESHEDDDLKGGVFTHYWCQALLGAKPSAKGKASILEILRNAGTRIRGWAKEHHVEQNPRIWGDGDIEIFQVALAFLQDPLERTRHIVNALRDLLDGRDALQTGDFCVRIRARLSSLALSRKEDWKEDEGAYRDLLMEERKLLIEAFETGASLKVILAWNLGEYFGLSHTAPGEVLARLKRLRAFCKKTLKDERLLARATLIRIPVPERNQFFLGQQLLFEGRKLQVRGGFDRTELIQDPDEIEREIEMFDALFEDGVQYCFERGREPVPTDPVERNRWLLKSLLDDITRDIKKLKRR